MIPESALNYYILHSGDLKKLDYTVIDLRGRNYRVLIG